MSIVSWLRGAEELVDELNSMPDFVGISYEMLPAGRRKEVLLGAYKSLRAEEDRRSKKRDDWISEMRV